MIQANEKKHGSTLIHCVYGKSRSATLCISYLLWVDYCKKQKCNFREILEYVQQKRSIVQPNDAFVDQLAQWESCLNENKKYFDPRFLNGEEEDAILTIIELSKKMSLKSKPKNKSNKKDKKDKGKKIEENEETDHKEEKDDGMKIEEKDDI